MNLTVSSPLDALATISEKTRSPSFHKRLSSQVEPAFSTTGFVGAESAEKTQGPGRTRLPQEDPSPSSSWSPPLDRWLPNLPLAWATTTAVRPPSRLGPPLHGAAARSRSPSELAASTPATSRKHCTKTGRSSSGSGARSCSSISTASGTTFPRGFGPAWLAAVPTRASRPASELLHESPLHEPRDDVRDGVSVYARACRDA